MCLLNTNVVCAALFAFLFGWPGSREPREFPETTVVGDQTYVTLNHLAQHYDFPRPRPVDEALILSNNQHRFELRRDSRRAEIDGVAVWLHEAVRVRGRRWLLAETDVRSVIDPMLRPSRYLRDVGHQVIVLDPGHGGEDEGGRGAMGTLEKDMTLALTRQVAHGLRQAEQRVYLTREDDRYLALEERVALAQEWGADLFVSIHFNAASNPDARGSETFVLTAGGHPSTADDARESYPSAVPANEQDGASMLLGYLIHRQLLAHTGNEDRGLRRARFYVLREAVAPVVLVECAFLTNPREERNVHREEYLERMAQGITRGIMEYLGLTVRAQLQDVL